MTHTEISEIDRAKYEVVCYNSMGHVVEQSDVCTCIENRSPQRE